ncbi:MAG: BON domain-containing protein [Oscillatoriophycideae cyanobacterium NC_groundwater_1537_Pr4_S-0.65um_50_18]|nr:BON domain-containing protein [Oscillatoriophycideae cyanobacterium NC_groundwater_1537_Pr4_S-0.65um_50_18]
MNKPAFLLLGSLLALNIAACGNVAKTSSEAPNSAGAAPETVDKPAAQTSQNDATSEMRRKQLNSDIRSREQRNNAVGDPNVRADGDLKSEVRSKLEANLPSSALAVDAKDGAVTVTGSVVNEAQLQKIEPLTKEIKGVQSVTINATIAVATPENPPPETEVPLGEHTGKKN